MPEKTAVEKRTIEFGVLDLPDDVDEDGDHFFAEEGSGRMMEREQNAILGTKNRNFFLERLVDPALRDVDETFHLGIAHGQALVRRKKHAQKRGKERLIKGESGIPTEQSFLVEEDERTVMTAEFLGNAEGQDRCQDDLMMKRQFAQSIDPRPQMIHLEIPVLIPFDRRGQEDIIKMRIQ